MMGHKQKIKTAAEYDLLSGWRHVMCYMKRPRVKHNIKKQLARRQRREDKREIRA